MWRPVRARLLARQGDLPRAEALAREGVRIADTTDDANRRAEAYRDLGEVLRTAGRASDANEAFERAIALFAEKGNLPGAAHVRSLQDDPALV
jgi:tetratricopeptide (TPR) repeat protein